MFERYTEKARRVIFFARYEASAFGIPSIETEHLLLGLLREDPALAKRFLPSSASVVSIRKQIEARTSRGEKISPSVDLPLSHESKRVLAYAAEESERLDHRHIGPEHLLLGLLREEKCFAAVLLGQMGLRLPLMRSEIAAGIATGPPPQVQAAIVAYLESLPIEVGVRLVDSRIYVRPDRLRGTPAFLRIEILSQHARFQELRQRIDDYFVFRNTHARYVWLLDPVARRAYVVTPEAGLQEFNGPVLRTENPVIELPLNTVFP